MIQQSNQNMIPGQTMYSSRPPQNQLSAESTPTATRSPAMGGNQIGARTVNSTATGGNTMPGPMTNTQTPPPMQAPPMQTAPPIQAQPPMQQATGGNTGAVNQNLGGSLPTAPGLGGNLRATGRPTGGGVAGGSMGGAPQFDQFQQYQDAAYENRMQTLQPQLEQQSAALAQSLVNRGLQPGSAAYESEMNRMQSAQAQALDGAHFGAMQFGLGAQNQAFSQQNAMDQLANALAISRGNNATQMGISNNNLALGRENLAWDQDRFGQEFGEGNRRFDLGFGEGQRQFNLNDSFRNNQNDFSQMMALEGLGYRDSRDQVNDRRYNDSLATWLIGGAPGMQTSNLDVMGAYNTNQQGNQFAYNAGYQQSRDAMNDLTGAVSMGAMFMSDARVKDNIKHIDTVEGVKVYEFTYKGDDNRFKGVMAQEVAVTHPDSVIIGPDGLYRVDYSKLPVDMEVA